MTTIYDEDSVPVGENRFFDIGGQLVRVIRTGDGSRGFLCGDSDLIAVRGAEGGLFIVTTARGDVLLSEPTSYADAVRLVLDHFCG